MKRDSLFLLSAVVGAIVLIIVIGLALSFAPNLFAPPQITPTPGGLAVEQSHPVPDFTLTDQNGKPVRLSDWRGKAVLMFFGYTHCPDVCPMAMADFRQVKRALRETSAALDDKVVYVMISVDGDRDTPEVMKRYVETFDPTFVGLTGDPKSVAQIGLDYGEKSEIQKPAGTQAGYLVAHTSFSYLIDPKGYWRVAYPFQTPTDQIAHDIERIVKQ
jgi:protein SCO1/2